jgi:uncharacterized membrane protein
VPESRSRKKKTYTPPVQGKSSKPQGNPRWLVPTMLSLMVGGLIWVVVTYLSSAAWPIPGIGNYNLLVGFVLIIAGFVLTTRWR